MVTSRTPGCHCCPEGDECDTPSQVCGHVIGVACPGEGDPPPIEGAVITIKTLGGSIVASGFTDASGDYCIEVDPGTYDVYVTDAYGLDCEVVYEDVVVTRCETTTIEDSTIICCGLVQVTVVDDLGAAVEGAGVSGGSWSELSTGLFQKTWRVFPDDCDLLNEEDVFVTAEGFIDGCLHINRECGELQTFTVRLYSKDRYVLANTSSPCFCGDCFNNSGRRMDVFKKVGQYLTFSGPDAQLGPWNGVSIPLNYTGLIGGYHVWDSDCLEGGGTWACYRNTLCENCVEGGASDLVGITRRILPEEVDDPGTDGDDVIKDFGSSRCELYIPAEGTDAGICAHASWINYYTDDCTEFEGTHCGESAGFELLAPLYCHVISPNLGDPCATEPAVNTCDYYSQDYDQNFGRNTDEPICAPPDATWQVWNRVGMTACPDDVPLTVDTYVEWIEM